MLNLKELKELIALMNENQLAEIELEREGMKVRLRKAAAAEEGVVIERVPTARSSAGPEPRVSRPTKTRPRPAQVVDARPSCSTRSRVRLSPTMPRTPSVPK